MSDYHLPLTTTDEVVRQEIAHEMDLSCENEVGGFDTRKEVESRESIVPSFSACAKLKIYENAGLIDRSGEDDEGEPEQCTSNKDDQSIDLSFMNVESRHGCDNTKMRVPTSDQGRYTKKLCCVYCLKRYAKLARHLESVHNNQPDVKRFRALPKGN